MYRLQVNSMSIKELRDLEFKVHAHIYHGVTFATCEEAHKFADKCREIVPHGEYWIEQI